MHQTTVVQVLAALSKKERRAFEKWLDGNAHLEVRGLCGQLCAGLERPRAALRKEQIWAGLFGEVPLSEARLHHLASWLLQALREWLAWREWRQNEAQVRHYFGRWLQRAGLSTLFEREWEQTRKTLETSSFRDQEHHYQYHLLLREMFDHQTMQRRVPQHDPQEAAEHFEVSYRLNQLQWQCSQVMNRAVPGAAKRGAEQPPLATAHAGIRLYESLLRILQNPDDEDSYAEAKHLLAQRGNQFRERERRQLYLIVLNYCIGQLNRGRADFRRETFEWYKTGLENEALLENGTLSKFTYKNITTLGLMLGEAGWVRTFIDDSKSLLPARERHNAHTFNLATYCLHVGARDQVLLLLRDVDFGADYATELAARCMMARVYYEKGESEALGALLDSFQAYLRRHDDIGPRREHYRNFLQVLRKMSSPQFSAAQAAELRQQILDSQHIVERDWLLARLSAAFG
jgi:hypothetical protein